jgi:methionine-S-sulfoxide reductase
MKKETAVIAGGCFWGIQFYFDQVPGVIETSVGYTGGHKDNPTYEDVLTHSTGHAEAVKIIFDPDKISFNTILKHFFRLHDPTQLNKQGPDIGDNYRSAIFYQNDFQKKEASEAIKELNLHQFDDKIVTKIEPASKFWPAEDYHQKFTERTGRGMCHVDFVPL